MHNKIYQISTSPITETNYLKENYFYDHWFLGNIADYISDEVEREDEINNISQLFKERQIAVFDDKNNSFVLLPNGKENYFKESYKNFIIAINEAMSISFEDFILLEKSAEKVRMIQESYCEKYEDYVFSDDDGLYTFTEFMRRAEKDTTYYIGAVLDYHW